AQTHVHGELAGAGAEVEGDTGLIGRRSAVEIAPGGVVEVLYSGRCRGEGRAIVEDRVAVEISTVDDVKRSSRVSHDEWAHAESMRQRHAPDEEQAVTNVEGSTPVVGTDTKRGVGGNAAGAGGIAFGEAETVVAEQTQSASHPHVEAGDELVLAEYSLGKILESRRGAGHE